MNTDAKRYYALLGLDPSCSDEDIRSAFRRRAKELHPDAGSGDVTAFIRLKRAYDTLNDPAERARYDRASAAQSRRARAPFVPQAERRSRPRRVRGMSVKRYVVAFTFVGGLSFGAIEAMISYADVPSSSHPVSLLASSPARETAKSDFAIGERADAAASPGFWDPSNPNRTPREAAEERARPRPRLGGFGSSSQE